jgi:hypothetical protein
MSRSYRKPYCTDQQRNNKASKEAKRSAARAVRQAKEPPANGKAYRKEFNPWDIRDWSFYSTEPKARRK